MSYLEELIKQIYKAGFTDSDSIIIHAEEGQPAVVHIRSGPSLRILIQTEGMDKLNEITNIKL